MLKLFVINSFIVAAAVVAHFEFLKQISFLLPHIPFKHRFRIVVAALCAMVAHAAETWLFALFYYAMIWHGDYGGFQNYAEPTLLDCAYFSFVTYTSLGYGDIVPVGEIRFLAGLEALTGLVLIAWTASFLYFEMMQYWRNE